MNLNDILSLCKAGFTAEQIGKMSAAAQAELPTVQPAPEVATPEPVKQEKEVVNVPAEPVTDVNEELLSAIRDLKQTMVAGNITNSNQPAPQVDTVDSIISQIIGGGSNVD